MNICMQLIGGSPTCSGVMVVVLGAPGAGGCVGCGVVPVSVLASLSPLPGGGCTNFIKIKIHIKQVGGTLGGGGMWYGCCPLGVTLHGCVE